MRVTFLSQVHEAVCAVCMCVRVCVCVMMMIIYLTPTKHPTPPPWVCLGLYELVHMCIICVLDNIDIVHSTKPIWLSQQALPPIPQLFFSIYIYVYVYIYIHTDTHTHMYVDMCVYIYGIHVYIYIYIRMYINILYNNIL